MLFVLLFGINGIAQSTGWPGNVKIMAQWTVSRTRGRIMGVWATCYQVGGIAATAVATWMMVHFNWRASFIGPAIWVAAVGIIVLLVLPRSPRQVGPQADSTEAEVAPGEHEAPVVRAAPVAVSAAAKAQRKVLRNPVVWCFGLSYFCLKLIRYSILFWLPSYLFHALHFSMEVSGYGSMSFEIGGVVGTLAMGVISDRVINRVPRSACAFLAMVGAAGVLWFYGQSGVGGLWINLAFMALVGSLLYAADSLISGAAAQDLGGADGASLAAGIVNGVGSVGAILQAYLTRYIKDKYGWDAVFQVFLVLMLIGAVTLIPTFLIKRWRQQARC